MTKREAILRAIETKLKTMTNVSSTNVNRSRIYPEKDKDFPAIRISPSTDQKDLEKLNVSDWKFMVRIEVFASGSIPDQAADPIVEELNTKIKSDWTLGGLVMDMRLSSVDPEFFEGSLPSVNMICDFEIYYRE